MKTTYESELFVDVIVDEEEETLLKSALIEFGTKTEVQNTSTEANSVKSKYVVVKSITLNRELNDNELYRSYRVQFSLTAEDKSTKTTTTKHLSALGFWGARLDEVGEIYIEISPDYYEFFIKHKELLRLTEVELFKQEFSNYDQNIWTNVDKKPEEEITLSSTLAIVSGFDERINDLTSASIIYNKNEPFLKIKASPKQKLGAVCESTLYVYCATEDFKPITRAKYVYHAKYIYQGPETYNTIFKSSILDLIKNIKECSIMIKTYEYSEYISDDYTKDLLPIEAYRAALEKYSISEVLKKATFQYVNSATSIAIYKDETGKSYLLIVMPAIYSSYRKEDMGRIILKNDLYCDRLEIAFNCYDDELDYNDSIEGYGILKTRLNTDFAIILQELIELNGFRILIEGR